MGIASDPTKGTDSDTYGAGDVITFEVKFSEAVTVTGAPFSSLNIASKCLLGSVANEPCAISCGGHSLECPSVHEG